MTLLLSDEDVRRAVDQQSIVAALETAFKAEAADEAVVPARVNLEFSSTWLRVMPALVPSAGVMGLKVFHGASDGSVRYLIMLHSMTDGSVLAAVDGCYLTAARTAATSAVASVQLARPGPVRLGVIGSGLEAETHCDALAAVTELTEVAVYSPNEQRRTRFAERMTATLGLPVRPCDRPEDALAAADQVVVATNTGASMAIACHADWLVPGQHVSAIGSTNPRLRELETDVFRAADVLVFDADPAQMAEESADVIEYCREGGRLDEVLLLSALVAGQVPGRRDQSELTVFKSVGTALQDVVAASVVYRQALRLGLGLEVPELSIPKHFSSATNAHDRRR